MIAQRISTICKRVYQNTCLKYTVTRALSTNPALATVECSEIEIDVPWGKVAGKLWGSKDVQPILAVHGWQDNAASFDNLAPLLVKNSPILAIDMPGHGLSSWIPDGMTYNEIIYVILIQRIKKYFGWKNVKLMGHSLGAQMSFWHCSIFPQETQFMIAIDALKFPSVNVAKYNVAFAQAVQNLFKYESMETEPMRYTEEELITRWRSNKLMDMTEEVCRMIMSRGAKKIEDGRYTVRRDPRLKVIPILSGFTDDYFQQSAQVITCPYLFIKATESSYFEDKKYIYGTLDTMRKNNDHVHYERIPGKHHLHISNPESVAAVINQFLDKYNV